MIQGNSNIFGFSITIVNIRAFLVGQSAIREQLCQVFSTAFNIDLSYGQSIYQQIQSNSNLLSTLGLNNGSIYDSIEIDIYNFLLSNFPNEPINNLKTLAMVANSLIFGYYVYSDVNINDFLQFLNGCLFFTAQIINNSQIFSQNSDSTYSSPFTNDIISSFLNSGYETVISLLGQSPQNATSTIVNYNWYDVTNLFTAPNLQLMKDIENQYYYISGTLIYSGGQQNIQNCIEIPITIQTLSGIVQSSYITNQPCQQLNTYIGPIIGTNFYRIFNDGPESVGDFIGEVVTGYINFDKSVLNNIDYNNNFNYLYSFETGNTGAYLQLSNNGVFTNSEGKYNIPYEYVNIPQLYSCTNTYQSMHVGGNKTRVICDIDESGNCYNCHSGNLTGFKFSTLTLDSGIWANNYFYSKTNPASSIKNILDRALNINQYSYLSELDNGVLTTINSNNQEYFGYPQLTGGNSLPSLAFYQTFDNQSFNQKSSISIFPSLGVSNGVVSTNDSDRTFLISNQCIASGLSNSFIGVEPQPNIEIQINNTINSNLLSDEISKTFFGMGDFFGNLYQISGAPSYNAGYLYSGYVINQNGNIQNIIQLNNSYSNNILGSLTQNIQYVNGYSDSLGNNYNQTKMYSQDNTGGLITYYYLDNRNLPYNIQVQENQWDYFSPVPTGIDNNTLYTRIIKQQQVENFLPRFSSGAYSNLKKSFLYPNAFYASNLYNSLQNGFPKRVKFNLIVREETVRELYGNYYITNNGLISNTPTLTRVIRPTEYDNINLALDTPIMSTIFQPNNTYYNSQYDFNNFGVNVSDSFQYNAPLNMVDNNWAPTISGIIPSGKNSNLYNNTNSPFFQGARLTGNGSLQYKIFTGGTGVNNYIYQYGEKSQFNGLFWYYNSFQVTGNLVYTEPVFDLSIGNIYINDAIQEAFPIMVNNNVNGNFGFGNNLSAIVDNSYFQTLNGNTGEILSGFDPIFLNYMGGRTGGFLAQQEGGYNPNGIIGDLWNNFSFVEYGMAGQIAGCGTESEYGPCYDCAGATRWPNNDNQILLINSTITGTNIFTRALSYNPFTLKNNPFIPFNGGESYNYKITGAQGILSLSFNGDFATFSLNNLMPNKKLSSGVLYDPTGLIIGPFDRNMEIGILSGSGLYSNGPIFFNGNQITDPSGFGACDINAQNYHQGAFGSYITMNSGIFPGENGRHPIFTIIDVIPQGQTLNINILSENSGHYGFKKYGNSLLTLRPRKTIGASIYNENIHLGEESWINPFYFLNNGLESTFNLNNNSFEQLGQNNYTFITYQNTGILYPVPGIDFTGLGSFDKFGNLIFPVNATVENYWKNYARKNNTIVVCSGWRDGSRISFEFKDIEIVYDTMPYQTELVVTPSGNCTISGVFGYYSQADASIFSEGIFLTDTTNPISNDVDDYTPNFLSSGLYRLPWLNNITGGFGTPILNAPFVMEQRKYIPYISGGQQYNKLLNYAPYNYNKLNWQAYSDLETLNEGETLEAEIPNDSITFTDSSLIFSASQGQNLPNGGTNPNINKIYDLNYIAQCYDSLSTDAILNSGKCITNIRGTQVRIQQSVDLSGILAPIDSSLSLLKLGFN